MHWTRIMLSLPGLGCFLILFLSTIFDWHHIRTALLKREGSIQVKGWFNVSGVTTLIVLFALCAGLTLSLPILLAPDENCNEEKLAIVKNCDEQKNLLFEKINQLTDDQSSEEKVVKWVEELNRDSRAAENIRRIARKQEGPWKPAPATELRIAVPGGVEEGKALGCGNNLGAKFQLSNPYRSTTPEGGSVEITVSKEMYISPTCRERTKTTSSAPTPCEVGSSCMVRDGFDLKISCADAQILFGNQILICDLNGNPKWNNRSIGPVFSVRAARVQPKRSSL